MEIVVKVNKFEDIEKLNNASSYLLANKNFSYRYDESFSLSKIKLVKDYCIKNNKKLYVLINKIFKDEDLTSLKEFMEKLLKINVDGFYFTDFAVFMMAQELKATDKCYFYHETFLRNTYDILTYQEYGIKNIICSKDMNINDIKNLPISKKDTYGILCFGYFPLYESQRKILTNYANINKLDKRIVKSNNLFLKEATRDSFNRVIEQNGTSSIFNSEVLSYLSFMKKLSENIGIFIIDGLFFNVDYLYKVIDLFKKAINEEVDESKLKELDPSIEFTTAFLNKRIGLM